MSQTVYTIGHGTRGMEELLVCLRAARVATLVDVRRFPGSRRNPQFGRAPLEDALRAGEIAYRHAADLGGRRHVSGDERFGCIENAAFRAYVVWMCGPEFQRALAEELAQERPCLMCAETLWWRCHRRLIADLLTVRGFEVVHLLRPGSTQPHRLGPASTARDGKLHVCGEPVA